MDLKILSILIFLFFIKTVNATNYCYQEFANVSTSCGGLSTGVYDIPDSYYFYINYTKPENATYQSLWEFKHGKPALTENISIPPDCWYADSSKLIFRVKAEWESMTRKESNGYCFNNTDWIMIGTNMSSITDGEGGGGNTGASLLIDGYWNNQDEIFVQGSQSYYVLGWISGADRSNASVYEEAMLWDMYPPIQHIDFSQLNYIRQFGKILHNHNVCVDNETLAHNITYQITIDQNQSTVNMWVTEPCEFGCDNSTERCNDSPINQYLYIGIVLLALIIIIAIIVKVSRR
jgi:hypothetical protein